LIKSIFVDTTRLAELLDDYTILQSAQGLILSFFLMAEPLVSKWHFCGAWQCTKWHSVLAIKNPAASKRITEADLLPTPRIWMANLMFRRKAVGNLTHTRLRRKRSQPQG
jgi:hypothetical protein